MMFLHGGDAALFAVAVTTIVYSNVHSYRASKRYITLVQKQKHIKQDLKTRCKVFPDLKLS